MPSGLRPLGNLSDSSVELFAEPPALRSHKGAISVWDQFGYYHAVAPARLIQRNPSAGGNRNFEKCRISLAWYDRAAFSHMEEHRLFSAIKPNVSELPCPVKENDLTEQRLVVLTAQRLAPCLSIIEHSIDESYSIKEAYKQIY